MREEETRAEEKAAERRGPCVAARRGHARALTTFRPRLRARRAFLYGGRGQARGEAAGEAAEREAERGAERGARAGGGVEGEPARGGEAAGGAAAGGGGGGAGAGGGGGGAQSAQSAPTAQVEVDANKLAAKALRAKMRGDTAEYERLQEQADAAAAAAPPAPPPAAAPSGGAGGRGTSVEVLVLWGGGRTCPCACPGHVHDMSETCPIGACPGGERWDAHRQRRLDDPGEGGGAAGHAQDTSRTCPRLVLQAMEKESQARIRLLSEPDAETGDGRSRRPLRGGRLPLTRGVASRFRRADRASARGGGRRRPRAGAGR